MLSYQVAKAQTLARGPGFSPRSSTIPSPLSSSSLCCSPTLSTFSGHLCSCCPHLSPPTPLSEAWHRPSQDTLPQGEGVSWPLSFPDGNASIMAMMRLAFDLHTSLDHIPHLGISSCKAIQPKSWLEGKI